MDGWVIEVVCDLVEASVALEGALRSLMTMGMESREQLRVKSRMRRSLIWGLFGKAYKVVARLRGEEGRVVHLLRVRGARLKRALVEVHSN